MYIDYRTDAGTRPTNEMRKAMYCAEVGDDVFGEDPSVNRLEETAAELLGKESALLVISHAIIGGMQTRSLPSAGGVMEPKTVNAVIRHPDESMQTSLLCIENTHNRAGGTIVPLKNMMELYTIAKRAGVAVHLDGARLMNAVVSTSIPVHEYARYTDAVQICLCKSLGAPVGAIVAGSYEFVRRARLWRKRLGGAMPQAGIIAAPGLVALTTMVERLAEDHENAKNNLRFKKRRDSGI
ncbi:threonine aldolase family protein [Aneurinibacillus tyrosinisolvens]|uniref:threonine aldolase family protein n=1 Tax=Aneurinibacillus tyrosinisolvens TaxID=1443435 RepID=UPI00069A9B08